MAAATRKENVSILANTNTISDRGQCKFVLVGGSTDATLSISIDGTEIIALAARPSETAVSPCIRFKVNSDPVVALTGTGAKAFAVWEIT